MSDLAHGMWAITVAACVVAACVVAVTWLRLVRRRIDIAAEDAKAVAALAKRFDDVEKTARELKTDWVNHKTVLGTKR